MFKFGIIAVGYQCAADFEEIIFPWLNRDNFYIALVNAKFKDFPLEQTDKTAEFMLTTQILNSNVVFVEPGEIEKEHEARNAGLKVIREKFGEMDYYWLLDVSDEFYKTEDIDNIVKFVESRPNIDWFSICLKNYVFTKNQFLEEEFAPPRIFKVNCENGIKFDRYYWDNDGIFLKDSKEINYKQLSNIKIPKNLVFVRHESWLDNERSKLKCAYQKSHFGLCSYKWDEEKNCLAFDIDFFYSRNLPLPKVITETTR